ncbi:MAG TPA: arginine--tRNA ligase [Actinomycetota bacterium]|nr:arginine--tRNA ligase [Actinomycetota bacterium]
MIDEQLRSLVAAAVTSAAEAGEVVAGSAVEFDLTRPKVREHGDWSVNAALVLQKATGRPPRQIAESLVRHMPRPDWVKDVQIAGPGFINFTLSPVWLHDTCKRVLELGPRFGSSEEGRGASVNIEFVSINPTGPLLVSHGRNAALGDSIARLLEFTGHRVVREYYFNDGGAQMQLFGASVGHRYRELVGVASADDFPEDGYRGAYVYEIAQQILDEDGDVHARVQPDELAGLMRERALPIVMGWIKDVLARFGIGFDMWFSETSLYESGAVDEVLKRLKSYGHTYDDEGAMWLRSTDFGDSRDRVLVRSTDGRPTYLVPDLAYHLDKAQRGFSRMVLVVGSDHHGQVPSLHAGMQALGIPKEMIEVIVYQFVHVVRGGQPVQMSKRLGTGDSLDELLDQVGVDAARYTLLQTSPDNVVNFDIELVARQTMDNPVYYVQYAHARIASILRRAADGGAVEKAPDFDVLVDESEVELMRVISSFEETVTLSARDRTPHRLTRFAEDLARRFHRFYTDCRVVTDDADLTSARLALSRAAKQVLANCLGLLGVSAPERMEREPGEPVEQDAVPK